LFLSCYLIFTQVNTGASADSAVTLFKRGSKPNAVREAAGDEEKQQTTTASPADAREDRAKEQALAETPTMTDIFSWKHLQYDVPTAHGTRRLLDDVSGYVAPGKLTALMGESGAGKTTLLNVLAQRTSTGVVTGDRFVNGHAPPPDFQAQT
jgi:ATP-binding cassette, subfamily G (WHITE), member 2, SNQ2